MTYKEARGGAKRRCEDLTETVKRLLFDDTKEMFAIKLGIAKGTLYRRLKMHNWTYEEKLIIDAIKQQNNG